MKIANKISIVLLAATSVVSLCMLPRTGTDAAKLLPAQVLMIAQKDGRITVESDNGASAPARPSRMRLRPCGKVQRARSSWTRQSMLFSCKAHRRFCLQWCSSGSSARRQSCIWRRMDALDAESCVDFLQAPSRQRDAGRMRTAALLRGETLSPAVLLPGENGGIILAG